MTTQTAKSPYKIASDLSYEIADAAIDYCRASVNHTMLRLRVFPMCLKAVEKLEDRYEKD